MLKLENISVSFGANHILKNLSCSAEKGDFIVILGTNGAGKSTFFDTIAGKVKPQTGTITLADQNITALNELQRSAMITRIFQNPHLNCVGTLSVAQNLAMALYSRRSARLIDGMQIMPHEQAKKLILNLGMQPSILEKPMNALSGGQRQLIAFTMATQLIPKILLLDEPTTALDPQASTKLLQHAAKFINDHEITTLLITHDPHIALSLGNKIWILENGIISKQFNAEDKKNLHPEQLIGQIDYAHLAK